MNTIRCSERLECTLSELDKVRMGARLADLCARKGTAVLAKQAAVSSHSTAIKEIDEAIQATTGILIRGYERRLVDCEWRMHDPRDGRKTLYRLDTGDQVTVEEMSYEERQGSLFPEAETPAVPWPEAYDGVYPDDDAEVLQMGDADVEPLAEIRVLQVGEEAWVGSYRLAYSGGEFGDSMEACYEKKSRADAIRAASSVALGIVQGILRRGTGSGAKSELKAIGDWFRSLDTPGWPIPDEDGTYPASDAEVLQAKSLPKGAAASIRVLQIGPEEWIAGHDVQSSIGGQGIPLARELHDANVASTRALAIAHQAKRVIQFAGAGLSRNGLSKQSRAQLLAIGKWAQSLTAKMAQAAEDAEREAVGHVIEESFLPEPKPAEAEQASQSAVSAMETWQ